MHSFPVKPRKRLIGAVASLMIGVSPIAIICGNVSAVSALQETQTEETVELAADTINYDPATGEIRALGNVELRKDGFTLRAGEIRYNERTGEADASAAVELVTPDGDTIIAPRLKLENALKDAFVENIRLIMADGAQVVANSAERIEETGQTTLKRAAYSPCKVCADGSGKEPLWQLKAVKVVHDKNKRRLIYDDAILEVLGIPIFWTPHFSHPDPTVDRASGLLPLDIQTSRNVGLIAGIPYYHVFNRSSDATITPVYTSNEGFLLKGQYRQHLGAGQFSFDGSITSARRRDFNNVVIPGESELRGHVSSEGYLNHSKNWRSTYRVNWASDDTFLGRYEISNADTLVSEYLLEGFYGPSYISARTIAFQGLRVEDDAGKTAFALPLIDAEFIPKFKPLGGTISLRGNALALHRTDGLDTRRLSLIANWQKRWITPKGFVLDVDALARSDVYNLDSTDQPDDLAFAGSFGGSNGSEWRNLARLTGSVSWPLAKFTESGTHTLEPILEVSVSPRRGTPDNIVNEDSRAFELSDLNLFASERTTGFDLWEEGSRATFGLRWRYEGSKLTTDVLIGQTWRINGEDVVLADGVGLEGSFSDIVGRTTVSYDGWVDFEHRYRLDDKSLAFRRNEFDVTFGDNTKSLRLGYINLDRNLPFLNREDREELRADGFYQFDENWRLTGSWTRRLKATSVPGLTETQGPVEYSVGVEYENECIQLGLRLRETFTRDRDVVPGTAIMFRLKLTNLG